MDFEVLERDAVRTLKRLPPEFLKTLATQVLVHKDLLIREVPVIFSELQPHIGAAMMENACGILDVKELETSLLRALAQFGVDLPYGKVNAGP